MVDETGTPTPEATPAPAAGPPLLELEGIHQSFPSEDGSGGVNEVLRDISFTAESGEVICILGPSGCGKSTILRMASGMHDRYVPMPTQGVARVEGKPVTGPHDDVLTVFQRPILNAWQDVRGNVMLPFKAGLWGDTVDPADAERRVTEILDAVDLSHSASLRPSQLSGGMQQRVSLAARLVVRPKILCLDEPFSALDPQTRAEMQELVLDLWQKYPCLALFVTHDVTEALRIADRILVLSTRPATIVADLQIAEPKPRRDAWFSSREAEGLESEIIHHIRSAAGKRTHGSLTIDV